MKKDREIVEMTTKEKLEQLRRVREKMAERNNKKDPTEFRPPKVTEGTKSYYIRVLPELKKGDKIVNGIYEGPDMDLWYVENGLHWVNNKPMACPRIFNRDKCSICQLGFDLFQEHPGDKEYRKKVAKAYLPNTRHAINVYFLDINKNPDELRGTVMWYNIPQTVYDMMDACISRDGPGDEMDPQAWGLFYDVDTGYSFRLEAKPKGDFNSYESSGFLPSAGPIFRSEDGSSDPGKIKEILAMRHNLFDKFPKVDMELITSVAKKMTEPDNKFDDDDNNMKAENKAQEQDTEINDESNKHEEIGEDDPGVLELLNKLKANKK